MINLHLNSKHFTTADTTLYDLFSSALYDGACYCERSDSDTFVISKNFKILLGYPQEENLLWKDIFLPQDLNNFQNILSRFDENSEIIYAQDFRVIHKSGKTFLMHCQIYSKPNPGSNVQFIFVGLKNITNAAEAEREMLLQQKRIDKILNGTAIGTWQYNLITKELVWNESLSKIVDYKLDELKDFECDFWLTLTHPDDFKKSQELFEDHIATGTSCFRNEVRMKHKDGHWVWVVVIGKVISYNSRKQPEWLGGIIYDITDKKNGELLALQYEDLLSRVNQAAKIGTWEVDLATKQINCSQEINKMFGVSMTFNPTLDDAINFIKEGKDRQKLTDSVHDAIEKGINYDIELEAITASKESIWIRAIGLSEFSLGKCTRFYGFIQNISQKTFANKELAIKEELFRKTFFFAPLGMAITDLDGKISQLNKNLSDFLGYDKDDLLQIRINKFSHPQDKDLTMNFIEHLLAGKKESFKLDKRYIHKDGSIIWAHISVSSIKDEMGEITNFVVQLQDITDRKRDELLLLNYKDLLDRSHYIAKIGSWEIDVVDHTVSWSDSLKSIIDTRENIIPTFQDSIEHFTREEDRFTIKNAIKNALEYGENFDVQILANVGDGNFKWVRMIGISEFADNHCERLYGLIQDIDYIKKVQVEIADKEEQWRTTFDHANAGIALINFEGVPYKVNQSMCDIFGYTIGEMHEIRIKDISLPDNLDQNIELMSNLINGTNNSFTIEREFVHKDQHIIWTNVTISAVKNDYNEFTHMVAQIIDITESKTNELLLKKYKEILERSNDVAKIGSWELDPKNQELFWSKNLRHLLGRKEKGRNFVNETITTYILEVDQEYVKNLLEEALQNGTNFDIEIRLKTATGLRWMRMIGISDFKNGICKLLHGLVQDIHKFKSAQLEIQLREQEFRQSFRYASTGMALIDLEGKLVRANPCLCETLGYTMQELIDIDKKFLSDPADAAVTTIMIEQLARGERESFEQEKRYYHKNQKIIWAILSMSTVKNDKGETTHYIALVTDITDKKLLTENLTEHNNRLQNFAYIVSHNLRSHTGNLTMLLEISELNDTQKIDQELFEHIKVASANMSETVGHLSEIVEIQNLIKNTLVPQNLLKRVQKALENVQATLYQIDGEVSIEVSEDFIVDAIPSYLDSIILNILTNAIKYRSPDRPLNIKIVAENKNGLTSLSFTDNGLGIDLDRHGSKIFGMYKTFHDHKNARGIGLFITKNQLEAMGGGIEVVSKQNVGSTFKIYFKNENN